jgi:hypothetical protein
MYATLQSAKEVTQRSRSARSRRNRRPTLNWRKPEAYQIGVLVQVQKVGSATTFRRPSLAALSYRETLQPVPRFGATDRTPADPLYFGHFNQSAKEIAPPGLRWALLLRSRVAGARLGVKVHVLPATNSRIQLIGCPIAAAFCSRHAVSTWRC